LKKRGPIRGTYLERKRRSSISPLLPSWDSFEIKGGRPSPPPHPTHGMQAPNSSELQFKCGC